MAERLPTFFGSVCYLKVGETPTLVVRSLPAEGKFNVSIIFKVFCFHFYLREFILL